MSSNVTTFAQYGALAALKEKEKTAAALKVMMTAFDRRRKMLHAELNKIPGISCLLAEGAFYLFPNIKSFGLTDLESRASASQTSSSATASSIRRR
jgi:aspartate aminotransferase